MDSTVARSIRALDGMPEMDTAMAVCHTPVPSALEITTASRTPGTALMTSIRRMRRMSTLPL